MMKPDPWVWRVEYADGSTLDEYDADAPQGRGWADVRARASQAETRITRVLLIPQRDNLRTHVIHVDAEMTVVTVLRRRTVTVSAMTGEPTAGQAEPITIVALDWLDGYGVYTFLFADGSMVVSDDLNAV